MAATDSIRDLQAFIDERWAVAQPKFYPGVPDSPPVPPDVTRHEAAHFLASVVGQGSEQPLFRVDDDRKVRSDRYPPRANGAPRGFNFLEEPGRVRLETIVHMAAMARLQAEFGWPREHLIFESPNIVKEGRVVLRNEALDILLLEAPVPVLTAKMSFAAARSRVAIEVKATAKILDKLLQGMRACRVEGASHDRPNHVKCLAIAELRARFFLGLAASDTWRLFSVVEHDGRAVLGEELPSLEALIFETGVRP